MNQIVVSLVVVLLLGSVASGQSSRSMYSYHYDSDRGWLGVSVEDVTGKLAEKEKLKTTAGAYVSEVVEESPAEDAGIREGDVIVKFDAKEIDDSDELIRAVRNAEPGEEVSIVLNRAGETKTVTARLDEMEAPRAFAFTLPRVPHVPPTPHGGHGMSFFRSGDRLGMEMQDLGKQLAEYFEVPGNRGVLVTSVGKKGSAAKAGVKAGDVIVRVNKNSVRDIDDVLDEVRDAEAASVPFEIIRKGKPLTVSMEIPGDEETSSIDDAMDGETQRRYEEAIGARSFSRRGEKIDDLEEALKELTEELKENALELREKLREELRNL